MSDAKNSEAHFGIDKGGDVRFGLVPFGGNVTYKLSQEVVSLTRQYTVRGAHKRGEVIPGGSTGFEVFLFLIPLLSSKLVNLGRRLSNLIQRVEFLRRRSDFTIFRKYLSRV